MHFFACHFSCNEKWENCLQCASNNEVEQKKTHNRRRLSESVKTQNDFRDLHLFAMRNAIEMFHIRTELIKVRKRIGGGKNCSNRNRTLMLVRMHQCRKKNSYNNNNFLVENRALVTYIERNGRGQRSLLCSCLIHFLVRTIPHGHFLALCVPCKTTTVRCNLHFPQGNQMQNWFPVDFNFNHTFAMWRTQFSEAKHDKSSHKCGYNSIVAFCFMVDEIFSAT